MFIIIVILLYFINSIHLIPVTSSPSIRSPILMYHNVRDNPNKLGKFSVSPKEFEEDLIYLINNGYSTITAEDLIAFEYNNIKLPEKPIMLTFDDGYSSNYKYIVPILQKYNCKAVMSIVGEYVENIIKNPYPDPYMNWSNVKELVESPYVEIQNHTYSMHKIANRRGCKIIKGESYDQYKIKILEDVGHLQNLMIGNTGYAPRAFTYRYGYICRECDEILKNMGFLVSFSCNIGVNYLSGNKNELYNLKRINRTSGINQENFFEKLEKGDF